MNKKFRLGFLVFAIIFCLSICTMRVMAVPEEGEVTPATDAPVVTQAPVYTNPPTQAPVYTNPPTQAPVYTNPPTKAPVYTTPATKPYVAPVTQKPVNSYVAPATSAYNNNNNNNVQQATSSGSDKSEMYNIKDDDIDVDTLNKKDWKEIEEQLKSADENGDDDVADFNFIKENNGKNDNGEWILFLGIAFEVIAAGIIVTLIILAVRRKKKVKTARRGVSPRRGLGSEQNIGEEPGPVVRRQASERRPSPEQSRQVRKRSKYDTDEVYIPKKRPQSTNRYKPKH